MVSWILLIPGAVITGMARAREDDPRKTPGRFEPIL